MSEEKRKRENAEEESEERGFRVTDRRIFTAEGDVREPKTETAGRSQEPPRREEPKPPRREEPHPPRKEERSGPEGQGQEGVDFSSFVLSLATNGMVHLGEIPEPATGKKSENLAAAREMIDILTLLKEKTKGNLSSEENYLLDNVLYELRMKFMSKAKAIKL